MTGPPDRYTAELESMIAIMSGDYPEARRWVLRIPAADRKRWLSNLLDLIDVTEQTITDGD